ncbi:hypothetical protein CULT_900008 [[Clostridium] ultunense Esp]|uniref:Uncharacterized protein n=1 Tax=[Clostridium] ultunense Esp TaxID=1288971 RepID=M1ZM96_9FIRM|nr:hypothetical protein [Schnuerera ultunensis]CCQ98567.1 hypothetical protein CULT_900008 [[Clostridium] ultunense Esp]SHD78572.1 conserved protein of unknown function [[Clostridium] ultunense Esp]
MSNEKLISIGVLGSGKNNVTFHIIREIFINSGYQMINYPNNIITILAKDDKLLLISELTTKNLESIANLNLYFHIIVHTSLKQDEYNNPFLKEVVRKAQYIVMNIDEKNSIKLLDKEVQGLIITYGLNNKATITTSSCIVSNHIEFNLCQQRAIFNINGSKAEPMEIPVILNLVGRSNIYYGLAAISCGLVYGENVEEMKKILSNIKGIYRHLEKIYDKEHMIIDSNCNIPADYNLVFEEAQNLKYKGIYVVNGIEIDQGIYTIKDNLKTILNWQPILNIKKLFLYLDEKEALLKNNIHLMLLNQKVDYEIFSRLDRCIYAATKALSKNDLLMILGSESLKDSREFINQLI